MSCRNPRRLRLSDGDVVYARCNCRLDAICPSCAELYLGDAKAMIREAVLGHQVTVITVTAPSFGAVHSRRLDDSGRPRRCSCRKVHGEGDPLIGTPIDPCSYRYDDQIVWNRRARRLRALLLQKAARLYGSKLPYIAVAELQARYAIHFHIGVIGRIPEWVFYAAVLGGTNPLTGRTLQAVESEGSRFGTEVKVDHRDCTDPRTAARVAGYLAKYLTKSIPGPALALASGAARHHLKAVADAARRHTEPCSCSRLADAHYRAGHLPEPIAIRGHRGPTAKTPAGLPSWSWDPCPRIRRAVLMAGYTGHLINASKDWPVHLADLRRRRQTWAAQNGRTISGPVRAGFIGHGWTPSGLTLDQLAVPTEGSNYAS